MKFIAEIGVNHNGSMNLAKKMILQAKKCKADYVKFQIFKTEEIIKKNTKKVDYQKNKKTNESQFELLKKLELEFSQFIELKNFSKKNNIKFFATAFDQKSFKIACKINDDFVKIPSGEIDNFILLDLAAKSKKHVLISTGMCSFKTIDRTFNYISKSIPRHKITLMQCTSEYPCNIKDLNLNVLKEFSRRYKCKIGLSDHSLDLTTPMIASLLGAVITEKHFTLDNSLDGPDHKASLNPIDFGKMVNYTKNLDVILGDKIKKLTKSELKTSKLVRKSIYAKSKIYKGQIIKQEDIKLMRPLGKGISPLNINKILNKKSKKDYDENEQILL